MKKFKINYNYCADNNNPDVDGHAVYVPANDFGHAEKLFREAYLPVIKGFLGITSIGRVNMEKWTEEERK